MPNCLSRRLVLLFFCCWFIGLLEPQTLFIGMKSAVFAQVASISYEAMTKRYIETYQAYLRAKIAQDPLAGQRLKEFNQAYQEFLAMLGSNSGVSSRKQFSASASISIAPTSASVSVLVSDSASAPNFFLPATVTSPSISENLIATSTTTISSSQFPDILSKYNSDTLNGLQTTKPQPLTISSFTSFASESAVKMSSGSNVENPSQ